MVYFVQQGKILKKQKRDLRKDRIRNHRFIPKTLELSVVDWGTRIDLNFVFYKKGVNYIYGRYDSEHEVKKTYERLVRTNEENRLQVHVYADGNAKLIIEGK